MDSVRDRVMRTMLPPIPVWVDMYRVLPDTHGDRPWWVTQSGLRITADPVPGALTHWYRTSLGGWVGLCTVQMRSYDSTLLTEARQLVPAQFIRPQAR